MSHVQAASESESQKSFDEVNKTPLLREQYLRQERCHRSYY